MCAEIKVSVPTHDERVSGWVGVEIPFKPARVWNDSCNSSPTISGLQTGILREVKRQALPAEMQLSNATEMILCNETEDPKESLNKLYLTQKTLKFARKN